MQENKQFLGNNLCSDHISEKKTNMPWLHFKNK